LGKGLGRCTGKVGVNTGWKVGHGDQADGDNILSLAGSRTAG
jgi:hypothetical protein